jgi:L-ribulokinase
MPRYALGLDFGTSSLRALLVDLDTGAETAHAEATYAHGDGGVITDPRDPDLARQQPQDYFDALAVAVPKALHRAGAKPQEVIGIGVDTTGSTPIPVDAQGRALAEHGEFRNHPAAQAWLWKDHTSQAEADEITARARQERPQYLERCGGTYSSEWYWSKVLRCQRTAPKVFAAAHSFVELCDFVPAWLVGERRPEQLARSVCAAGHKALYADDWGGLPDAAFLGGLAPDLLPLREHQQARAQTCDQRAGTLSRAAAAALSLVPDIPVAVGALDAHLAAVGAGIKPGDLVKVIGTSSCDMAVAPLRDPMPSAHGLCGVVAGSILPGLLGFEAGQSAVGDIFAWCGRATNRSDLAALARDAAVLRGGQSGLLALDWHHGNRCVLVDPALSGLVLGLNLHTTDAELYRAMIEATAFGARVIVERLRALHVPVAALLACGGIAHKSPLVLQTFADVLARPIHVARSPHASALGAAITGAVAGGAFPDLAAAQRALVQPPSATFTPEEENQATYARLFPLYLALHDAFGTPIGRRDLREVMKELLAVRNSVRAQHGGAH